MHQSSSSMGDFNKNKMKSIIISNQEAMECVESLTPQFAFRIMVQPIQLRFAS
jgi:hypothetical protein